MWHYLARFVTPAGVPYDIEPLPGAPAQAPGPMPWENPELPLLRRFTGTVSSTFLPLGTIRAVSSGAIGPALGFMLVWMVPWMPLWAIMPFTHSLLFKYSFAVEVVGSDKSTAAIGVDVARAMGIGLLLSAVSMLSWAMPFASLLRAFAKTSEPGLEPGTAAWRMVLYRSWIVPCGLTLFSLLAWSLPKDPNALLVDLALVGLYLMPRVLILMHCFTMARYFGAAGLASMAVALLPLAVEMAVGLVVGVGAESMLPKPAAKP
jgi:hypothetical protein